MSRFNNYNITPPKKLSVFNRLEYIVKNIINLYNNVDKLAIEDIYLGRNFRSVKELSRLAGAVIYTWMSIKGTEPIFYMAVSARKLVGIHTNLNKADIQLWVLHTFFKHINIQEFKDIKTKLIKPYVKRKITMKAYQKSLDELSKDILLKTDVGNDEADAIVIGYAHYLKKNKRK
jgi:Holliday junction resolvasome RuvABC endonuclease subunit